MRPLTLTFDNGPTPGVTERVLDVLGAHGVPATFFVIGQKVMASEMARASMVRAHAEGHWIGNHTFTHSVPLGEIKNDATALVEIARTEAAIGALAHSDKLFRPYGRGGGIGPWLLSGAARDHLVGAGYTLVLWNVIPRDWEDPAGWVARAWTLCASVDWPLVVLHDIEGAALDRLDAFLIQAKDRGYAFRQDFPPACVPVRRGALLGSLDGLVAPAPPGLT